MTVKPSENRVVFHKLTVIILAFALAFSLSACSSAETQPADTESDTAGLTSYGSSEVGVYGEATPGTDGTGTDPMEEWAWEAAEAGEEWMTAAEEGDSAGHEDSQNNEDDQDHEDGHENEGSHDHVEDEDDEELDYRVFSSEKMGFSFLYDAANSASMTDTGAAELTVNGNTQFTGLFVSVMDAADMPEIAQILEEESFNAVLKYGDSLVRQPEESPLELEGHTLSGLLYTYLDKDGQEVLCTCFIEQRDGRYVIFRTKGLYEGDGKELEAFGGALVTLEFDTDIYGESDAAK